MWAADLADTGSRPNDLSCVGCQQPVRLRAGAKNRPHFAHVADAACPGGETALHRTAIRVLQASILSASAEGLPYPVHCICRRCDAERDADLSRRGCVVVVDQILEDGIRPDLLVSTANGQRLAVIEVIVTHAPEDAALAVYDRLGLPVIRVWPTWDMLTTIRSGLGPELAKSQTRTLGCFEVAGTCRFPRHRTTGTVPCPTCRKPARQLSVETATAKCWSCHHPFNVLDVIDCTDADPVLIAAGCPELTDVKAIAASRGVLLATKHSKAAGGSYLMHLCARLQAHPGRQLPVRARRRRNQPKCGDNRSDAVRGRAP